MTSILLENRLCACGCGIEVKGWEYHKDRYGPIRFVRGHHNHFRTHENHPLFKGDNVKYGGLHDYVKKYKPTPIDGLCEFCHEKPFRDLANITGIYKRDFGNWKYLCRKCHFQYDFAIGVRKGMKRTEVSKLKMSQTKKRLFRDGTLIPWNKGSIPHDRKCYECGSIKTNHDWYVIDREKNQFRCTTCYNKFRWRNRLRYSQNHFSPVVSAPAATATAPTS
ncbi:MAG TPA: hypothetical protein VJ729_16560 [Nitrososphaeraceae archaeon]|nr:hypothetical protein [Nitrososphaeraceae archaeon]